ATSIVSSVIYAIINYKLLKRKNDHIKRETALRAGIIDYFRAKGAANFKEQALASQIATMQSIQSDSTTDDRDHNAILFTILLFIPIVNIIVQLYIAYVLTKFDYKHDRRWHAFTQQAQSAGQELGMPLVLPSWKTLPERSFVIYLILTILTLGLFWFYWYYCFIKDLNEHFKAQWQFEDQFLRSLQ
ncbi:MAG: DUF4234 domain-containing protein, partial [Methanomassiliicoccales archaeon]|nr:DUF4234 domain-containing protein [Methanomassiliicoccales archaeon]